MTETVLLLVTAVSLVLAVGMSVLGWKLLRAPVPRADSPRVARRRPGLALAAAAVIIVSGVVTTFAVYPPDRPPQGTATDSRTPMAEKPLELMSLRNDADPDGSFLITGTVENPAGGRPAGGIMAVIYLFDRSDRLVASRRAALAATAIEPGTSATFAVRVPEGTGIGRYRVTFQRDTGALVPHVDRRTSAAPGA
jgi:hypothetical protein